MVESRCTAGPSGLAGAANLLNLVIDGRHQDAALPNQDISIPGDVHVTLNERLTSGGKLTVNAVHITTGGPIAGVANADVVLSHAVCALPAGMTPPSGGSTPGSPNPAPAPGNGGSGADGGSAGHDAAGIGGSSAVADRQLAETGVSESPSYVGGAGVALLAIGGGAL